jgi:hypothetical protein
MPKFENIVPMVTEQNFAAYVAIQNNGLCNMLDPYVCVLGDFDRSIHLAIIENYGHFANKWPHIKSRNG